MLVITALCLYQYCMVTGPLEEDVSAIQSCTFLSFAWTIAVGMAIGPLFKWGKYEISTSVFGCKYQNVRELQRYSYNGVLMLSGYLVPLGLMVFCYLSVLWSTRDSDRRMMKGWVIASTNNDDTGPETGQQQITMTTLLILTAFVSFRTPFFVSVLLSTFELVGPSWLALADQTAFWAIYFHAASDPFIYAFQQGEYSSTLKSIASTWKRGLTECCCCCCNKVEDGEIDNRVKMSLQKIEEE